MYLVTIDNNLLHDPRIKDYQVLNPVLSLEINKAHSFNFTIRPNNPMFNSIDRLKSIIEVYDDGELIFRGRPLNDTADFNKATTIQCEGELAYLNDSTMEPYSYFGTVRGLLELYINNHNAQVDASKQFTMGTVNVVGDFVRSNIEYTNTWEELSTKTFGSGMGGYLRLRREDDINYIDYLNDSTYISGQTIELSKNLLDYEKTVKASEIVTVLIPLGAKLKDEEGNETDERLTIESVNAGSKFVEHTSGIAKYGRIVGYKIWDDINSPSLLKTRATNDLNFLVNLGISIKIKAIDLNILDKSIPKIRFFEYVKIISKPHEIDDSMLIKKQTIHLDDPSQNTIEVGVEVSSFTDKQLEVNNTIKIIKSDYVTNEKMTNVITPLTIQVSKIIQHADSIELSVNELRTDLENIELTPGPQGPKGDQGIPGQDGTSLYTWIKYADTPTTGMSDNPTDKKYVGFAYNKSTQTESTNYADYEWQLVKGADGLNGQPGADGKTYYNWIAYADTSSGGGISLSPTNKNYVGYAFNKETKTPSLNASDYQWQLVKGEKGDQGIQGEKGADGLSQYTHIRYSQNANGNPMTTTPDANTKYIGIAVNTSATAPSGYASYSWAKFVGEDGEDGEDGHDGIPGTPGADGITYYTWIKYADTPTTGMSNSPSGKNYIGIAHNQITAIESSVYSDYAWSLIKGDKGDKGDQGPQGLQGIPGEKGADGQTTYTWLKYADSPTSGMSDLPAGKKYMGIAVNQTTQTESTNYSDYTWSKIEGDQGIQGPPGANGQPTYTWVKYADTPTSGMSNSATDKKYIGLAFNKSTPTMSTNYSEYQWSLMPQNIEIGGRNYAYGLNFGNFNFNTGVDNTSQFNKRTPLIQVLPNEKYVVSVTGYEAGEVVEIRYVFRNSSTGIYTPGGSFNAYVRQITIPDDCDEIKIGYGRAYGHTNVVDFDKVKLKLEKGDIPTDWSPAPEDVQNEIERVETESNAKIIANTNQILLEKSERETQYGTLNDIVSDQGVTIELVNTRIDLEVSERESMGDIILSQTRSLIEQESTQWQMIFEKLEGDQELTSGELTLLKTYFRYDINGAIIGQSGNPIEFFQTPDKIGFRENGITIAEWKNRTMEVDNLIARISIVIGTHQVEVYDSPVVGKSTIIRQVDLIHQGSDGSYNPDMPK